MTSKMDKFVLAKTAVIFEVDGVLCEDTRLPVDPQKRDLNSLGQKCLDAAPREEFVTLAKICAQVSCAVFVLTARSEKLYMGTRMWLSHHNIICRELFMRPQGDMRPACELKRAMLDDLKKIYGVCPGWQGDLQLALDSDPATVQMYRAQGAAAWLVAPAEG